MAAPASPMKAAKAANPKEMMSASLIVKTFHNIKRNRIFGKFVAVETEVRLLKYIRVNVSRE